MADAAPLYFRSFLRLPTIVFVEFVQPFGNLVLHLRTLRDMDFEMFPTHGTVLLSVFDSSSSFPIRSPTLHLV